MMLNDIRKWIGWCLLAILVAPAVAEESDVRDSIVKIYTVRNQPNYYNPWTMYGPRQSTGSGCVIAGRRILTNAHVVSDQTFIQVRRNGDSKRYQARLISVSHEADLALLTVDDDRFFNDIEPLEFGTLPNTEQEVIVLGFPLGGDTLSITKGVLSRIEHQTYSHSSCSLLAGQIDAAINPGNSGGPVMEGDRIVGVAMQALSQADNIGYMVPMPVIEHFLTDIEDGHYDNFPSLGIVTQEMENPSLKAKYKASEDVTGVLVIRILPDSPADGILAEGDMILAVDGYDVADDGTIEFRPRHRTSIAYAIQQHQVGDTVTVNVLRGGEVMDLSVALHRSMREDWLIPMEIFDRLPSYYIYGGVVFCPLTKNLLMEWGNNWYNAAPKELVAMLGENFRRADLNEVVLVLKVLAADVNQGYHNVAYWPVETVNGTKVRDLRHLIELVETQHDGPFMELRSESGHQIVLDRGKVADLHGIILDLYRISGDRSPDLLEPEVSSSPKDAAEPANASAM